MTKYVIIGGTGQLGQAFAERLGAQAIVASRPTLDIAVSGVADAFLEEHRPEIVLNCAAYNHVDRAEMEPHTAFAVNSLGVRELARACAKIGAFLVHFSTDYVFGLDRERRHPYTESDVPGPINVYGASKLTGEYFVRSIVPRHLVVRTCGLYGRVGAGGKKTNFVETVLSQIAAGCPVRVVADQVCSPTYVPDLVEAVLQCLDQEVTGLIHLVNEGEVSWYEFACSIVQQAKISADIRPVSSSERGAVARRPAYSALTSQREDKPRLRSWRSALQHYLATRGLSAGIQSTG